MSDSAKSELPVLIVGGGIGGISAAIALARVGYPVHIIEQASRFGEIGAGIQLGPNAYRTLERLGIGEALRQHTVMVDEMRLMDSVSDKLVIGVPLGQTILDRFGAPYSVIHRADLHASLVDACMSAGAVTVENSQTASAFEEVAGGVRLRTEEGKEYLGAALIGADGMWSRVRAQLLNDGKPRFSYHTAYRAMIEPDEMPEELRWNAATLWAGPNTHLVHYPISGGRKYNIVACFASNWLEEGWNEPGDRDELLRHFRKACDRAKQILYIPKEWRRWALCDRDPVEVWSRGRVTLLGDAAHPMLQYFAQGAAMAMEDGVCIGEKVEEAQGDFAAAFKAYERERGPRTSRVQLHARNLGTLYHARGIRRFLRNRYLRKRTPEQMYEGLDWIYSGP